MSPDDKDGIESWNEVEKELDGLLRRLWDAPGAPRLELEEKPGDEAGVYLFVEYSSTGDVIPMYVGQSQNLGERLGQHCRASSGHEKASFAFNLAKEELKQTGVELPRYRKAIQDHAAFQKPFKQAKERVEAMEVRWAGEPTPELRTVFEVFAHLRLRTRYNSFQTH